TLAAAGIGQNEIAGLVSAADAYLQNYGAALAQAVEGVRTARANLADARRRAEREPALNRHAVAGAEGQLLSADEAVTARLNEALAVTGAGLSEAKRTSIARIRGNSRRQLPAWYLVVDRTEAEWQVLKHALEHASAKQKIGETPDSSQAQVIA